MRTLSFAIFAAASVVMAAGSISTASAAGSRQDNYCLQGRSYGYPGNCQFSTYEQCLATASGTDSSCGVNPLNAFAQQRRGGYSRQY